MQKSYHILLVLLLTVVACNNQSTLPVCNPEFVEHISAYTSGVVGRDASVKVVISEPIKQSKMGKIDPNILLDFSPSIKGKAQWVDNRTIEFTPDEKLPRGTVYQGVFYLGKLKTIKRELKKFPFRFETRKQKLNLVLNGIRTYGDNNPRYRHLSGMVQSSDKEQIALIKECLSADDGSKPLNLFWQNIAFQRKQFPF